MTAPSAGRTEAAAAEQAARSPSARCPLNAARMPSPSPPAARTSHPALTEVPRWVEVRATGLVVSATPH